MASDSITSMVLDEVRSMRLAYNTTSPFPVVVPSSSRSSTSFSSTSVSSASGPKIIREYSTRPSESNTSLNDADQSRKRALDQSDGEVDGKRRAIASSTSTSVTATPVLRYRLTLFVVYWVVCTCHLWPVPGTVDCEVYFNSICLFTEYLM